jgi:hypothetical protein
MIVDIEDLTGAECGDIAITAAEGGIGYWSQILTYDYGRWSEDAVPHGANVPDDFVFYTIRFENPTGPGEIEMEITPALLKRGFERMSKAPLDKGGWPVPKLLAEAREDWTGEIDSDIADMLVQFGVFGEVVFG